MSETVSNSAPNAASDFTNLTEPEHMASHNGVNPGPVDSPVVAGAVPSAANTNKQFGALEAALPGIAASLKFEREDYEAVDYDRTVTLEFPEAAAAVHGVNVLTVSYRDVLSWFAEHHCSDEFDPIALRDDFYAGDSEDDYEFSTWDQNPNYPTNQDVARFKLAHEAKKSEREATKSEVLTNRGICAAAEEAMWRPFLADKQRLDLEKAELDREHEKLISDWMYYESFIVALKPVAGDNSALWQRVLLEERDEKLGGRYKSYWARQRALEHKVKAACYGAPVAPAA